MNIANSLTILRIFLTPLFVLSLLHFHRYGQESWLLVAIVLFVMAAITDGLDGFLARRMNQKSKLGALLDPIADKLLLLSSYITLAYIQMVPAWLLTVVIAREVLIVSGVSVYYKVVGNIQMKPHLASKLTTLIQILTIAAVLVHFEGQQLLFYATAMMSVISGAIYARIGIHDYRLHILTTSEK